MKKEKLKNNFFCFYNFSSIFFFLLFRVIRRRKGPILFYVCFSFVFFSMRNILFYFKIHILFSSPPPPSLFLFSYYALYRGESGTSLISDNYFDRNGQKKQIFNQNIDTRNATFCWSKSVKNWKQIWDEHLMHQKKGIFVLNLQVVNENVVPRGLCLNVKNSYRFCQSKN